MEQEPIAHGPVDVDVRWLPGWYASRLHAIPVDKIPHGQNEEESLCGAYVFGKAPTDWAQRRVDKGFRIASGARFHEVLNAKDYE